MRPCLVDRSSLATKPRTLCCTTACARACRCESVRMLSPIRPRATTTMLDGTVRPSRVVPAERASRALLCVRLCVCLRLCVRACSPGSGARRLLGWSKSISSPNKSICSQYIIEYIRSLLLRPAAHHADWMPPGAPSARRSGIRAEPSLSGEGALCLLKPAMLPAERADRDAWLAIQVARI